MAERPPHAALSRWLVLAALLLASIAPVAAEPVDQLSFGTQMAQRGLWSEALFRFRQAEQADPNNPRILNNIAVALEALGLYDQALDAYREAVDAGPGLQEARRNYARFVEFYQAYRGGEVDEAEQSAENDDDRRDATEPRLEEAADDDPGEPGGSDEETEA